MKLSFFTSKNKNVHMLMLIVSTGVNFFCIKNNKQQVEML